MESKKVIATITVKYPKGEKDVETELKNQHDIGSCEEGKFIYMHLFNGNEYSGIFKGMDEETVLLGSLVSEDIIGIESECIENYFEEILNSKKQ